jgi:ethanolamine utilization protein EutN
MQTQRVSATEVLLKLLKNKIDGSNDMLKGIVVGNVVSTKKQESLMGSKFLEINLIENGIKTDKYIIAVDSVGAGIGEVVLVTTGSSARLALRNQFEPVDAVIVGIVD